MDTSAIYSLTNGPVRVTFEETMASIFNYGFRQSVYEVERLNAKGRGKTCQPSGEVTVLRAGATQVAHPLVRPGNQVHCPGLEADKSAAPTLYRIRRMAEGFSRTTMTELT